MLILELYWSLYRYINFLSKFFGRARLFKRIRYQSAGSFTYTFWSCVLDGTYVPRKYIFVKNVSINPKSTEIFLGKNSPNSISIPSWKGQKNRFSNVLKRYRNVTLTWNGISHLCKHKFKHSFQDTLNSLCSCGKDVENTFHFLLSSPNYSDKRLTLLSNIRNINLNP